MKPVRIKLIPNDWPQLERILNYFSRWVASQPVTEISSPTFLGLKIDSLNGILKANNGIVSGDALIYDDSFKCLLTNY